MDEGDLEYFPERFRESARHNREAADIADGLARRLGNVTVSPGFFGGDGAAVFTGNLDTASADRARRARRAQEDRDGIGAGGDGAADLGEETDGLAQQALHTPNSLSRSITEGM